MSSIRLTMRDTGELIDKLDHMMDTTITSRPKKTENEAQTMYGLLEAFGNNSAIFNGIWKGFLDHCRLNELNPVQQISEAISSNYQDNLKTYRIRMRLALNDSPNLV